MWIMVADIPPTALPEQAFRGIYGTQNRYNRAEDKREEDKEEDSRRDRQGRRDNERYIWDFTYNNNNKKD